MENNKALYFIPLVYFGDKLNEMKILFWVKNKRNILNVVAT